MYKTYIPTVTMIQTLLGVQQLQTRQEQRIQIGEAKVIHNIQWRTMAI